MSIQTALVAIKTANSTLNTLIGSRFHPDALPQGITLPAVRFQVISRPNMKAMNPTIVNYHARVQMDGYEASSSLRTTLRNALKGCFFGYSGAIGGETVKSILLEDEREDIEMLDTQTQAYRVSLDFIVDLA